MFDEKPDELEKPSADTKPRISSSSQGSQTRSGAGVSGDEYGAVGTGTATAHGRGPPPRKSRVALACKRCKRRKQRCDGAHPSCKSCERASSQCIYERTLRPQYPGGKTLYINALEERIAFLEARLPAYAEDHFNTEPAERRSPTIDSPDEVATPSRRGSCLSQGASLSDEVDVEEPSSLVEGVAYLSLCASGTTDTTPEPFYLGSSSGATVARMIQSSIFRSSGSRAISQAMAVSQSHQPSVLRPPGGAAISVDSDDSGSEFPSWDQAQLLFNVFFDRMHTRWPLLDRERYTQLFERQYEQGALSIIDRSIMHLIYAISARFLQLTRKPCGVDPERHLLAAIEPMDYILEQHNLATVQFLLLLAVHGQRSPYGAGAWAQVRYATSVCIELGLHRKRRGLTSSQDVRTMEIRRRAFWACYCLDRLTSIVLGRAFAIADRDINVELPSTSPEFWSLTHKGSPDTPRSASWSNVEPFIHIIKLDIIQSKIHRTVFRVDKDVIAGTSEDRARLDQKMVKIRESLDDWARAIPRPPKDADSITWMYDPESSYYDSRDFFNLQYHKTVLALFTVLLPTVHSSDPRFVTSARSAACVCTAYKRLNHQKTLSYTMVSLHSCFVAGLTLVYCLWRDRSLFSSDALEATRACSQSLTIFGEKWPGAVKYRDIFDALSGSLFKTIVNPVGPSNYAGPLRVDLDADLVARPGTPQATSPESHTQTPVLSTKESNSGGLNMPPTKEEKPTMSHLVSDAVKEAFMEVDVEAPGGWQGWRMWNEMVTDDTGHSVEDMAGSAGLERCQPVMGWDAYSGGALFDLDPVQHAATHMHDEATMDVAPWDMNDMDGMR